VLAVTVNATVTATSGSFANAATVTLPIDETNSNGVLDLTGTDQLDTVFVPPPPIPTLGLLDNFNRANSLGLGSNWNVTTAIGIPTLGVNTNQAAGGLVNGVGYWNGAVPNTGPVFGVKQGAAFTITTSTSNNDALMLKVSGATNSSGVAANFIRVLYSGGNITVGYTTNNGGAFVTTAKPATVANGSTLTAVANTDGSVDVWVTTAANVTTYIGNFTTALASTAPFTGTGRIGLQVAAFARVDNFAGGTL